MRARLTSAVAADDLEGKGQVFVKCDNLRFTWFVGWCITVVDSIDTVTGSGKSPRRQIIRRAVGELRNIALEPCNGSLASNVRPTVILSMLSIYINTYDGLITYKYILNISTILEPD